MSELIVGMKLVRTKGILLLKLETVDDDGHFSRNIAITMRSSSGLMEYLPEEGSELRVGVYLPESKQIEAA